MSKTFLEFQYLPNGSFFKFINCHKEVYEKREDIFGYRWEEMRSYYIYPTEVIEVVGFPKQVVKFSRAFDASVF